MILQPETDEQILATHAVMSQLRPHLSADDYLQRVRRMMRTDGYRLAAAADDDGVARGVAGYRFIEMLYCGKILVVDDLVTDEDTRSRGFGKQLLDWLVELARERGCEQLHLDSGVQRHRAHRFYFREGLVVNAFHFWRAV
jgi:GNAT superfamily N-acetyltransferase